MTIFAIHDDDGVLGAARFIETAGWEPAVPEGLNASPVDEEWRARLAEPLWFDTAAQVPVAAEMVTVQVDRASIVANGSDAATLSALPDPCWLRIDNAVVKVTGGSHAITSMTEHAYQVELGGKHRSQRITIIADTIEGLRARVWMRVKLLRDDRIDTGAPSAIGVVDSDLLSRTNITGAVVAAQMAKATAAPFLIDWTDRANAVHALDADGMIGVGLAVMAHVNACHDRARALRVEIEAAATMQQLDAIDITAGWP